MTATTMNDTINQASAAERVDLLQALGRHRFFLRFTARDLTDEESMLRTTASTLTIGGLIKHVTGTEAAWARFIVEGPTALGGPDPSAEPVWDEAAIAARTAEFTMLEGETLDGLLAAYEQVAGTTDDLVRSLPDLGASHPLPVAPWFEPGAHWSARRVLLHIIAETAQHAGHADVIRESLDGAQTMA